MGVESLVNVTSDTHALRASERVTPTGRATRTVIYAARNEKTQGKVPWVSQDYLVSNSTL